MKCFYTYNLVNVQNVQRSSSLPLFFRTEQDYVAAKDGSFIVASYVEVSFAYLGLEEEKHKSLLRCSSNDQRETEQPFPTF